MSRLATLLLILALLLCSTQPYAARPVSATAMTKHQNKGGVETAEIEEGCEGIDEDECLMRRILVAHTDYIYTQKKNP
ncbi:hypothetical protein R6Q59_008189 [Mikania micrantha]|uniref:Phytosulfokine n=1 Tax=Mikania micrantha TaxID=192012 RepID=A0A5N6Q623_9ASTR|nr:hypothetical protein E3N88_02454 [Mikania micrantha]